MLTATDRANLEGQTMSKIRATLVLTLGICALLSLPVAAAEWDHRVNSVQKDITGKVPTTLTQATAVPANTGGPANICAGFGHTFNQTEQGYLKVKFSTFRTDPKTGDTTTQTMRKKGAVVDSQWVRCVVVEKLFKDDIVVAEWEILEMPRGRGGDIQTSLHIGENRLPLSELISRKSGSTLTMSAHRVNSVQKNIKGKVPAALTQATAVTADTGKRVDLCAGFGHTFKQTQRGRLRVRFSTFRTDPETGKTKRRRTRITGRIEDSRWVGCLKVEKLLKNDIVVAEWEILDMPRGRGGEIQAVTHIGDGRLRAKELISRPPPTVEPPTGGGGDGEPDPDPPPPPPTDTGQVSAADQRAISAMSKSTAISIGVRVRGGGRTFLIGHRHNCANLLEAPTIAAVYDKYVKACGARTTGGALTRSQIDAIAKLKRMKHTSALRWESGGRVLGEYWSRATGTRHVTTNSIEKAVAWLVKEGRL